jgi:hypothetical protein
MLNQSGGRFKCHTLWVSACDTNFHGMLGDLVSWFICFVVTASHRLQLAIAPRRLNSLSDPSV